MANSETLELKKGHGEKIVGWLNEQSKMQNIKLEARLYNYEVSTKTSDILKGFHGWEMFKLQEK